MSDQLSLEELLQYLAAQKAIAEAYEGTLTGKCATCQKKECPILQAYAAGQAERQANKDLLN